MMASTVTKATKRSKNLENDTAIKYELSDGKYIEMGWTVLPKDSSNYRLIMYEAEPAKPYSIWFKKREEKEIRYYKNGTVFLVFNINATGSVFYPDGQKAIRISEHEKGIRITVLSPAGKDDNGIYQHRSLLAMFDLYGNGIVYNIRGDVRLKYNQKEGVLLDTPNGLPVHWKWKVASQIEERIMAEETFDFEEECLRIPKNVINKVKHIFEMKEKDNMNDKKAAKDKKTGNISQMSEPAAEILPHLDTSTAKLRTGSKHSSVQSVKQIVLENNSLSQMDNTQCLGTTTEVNDSQLSVHETKSQEKRMILTNRTFTPIKFIVMKINKYLSLRILDQENIRLQFNAGNKFLRMELGVRVNPNVEFHVDKLDWDTTLPNDLPCHFELVPTSSMSWNQRILYGQRLRARDMPLTEE